MSKQLLTAYAHSTDFNFNPGAVLPTTQYFEFPVFKPRKMPPVEGYTQFDFSIGYFSSGYGSPSPVKLGKSIFIKNVKLSVAGIPNLNMVVPSAFVIQNYGLNASSVFTLSEFDQYQEVNVLTWPMVGFDQYISVSNQPFALDNDPYNGVRINYDPRNLQNAYIGVTTHLVMEIQYYSTVEGSSYL